MKIPNILSQILTTYSTLSEKYPFALLFLLFFGYTIVMTIVGRHLRNEWEKKQHFWWALGIMIICFMLALMSLCLAILQVVQFPHGLFGSWGFVSALQLFLNLLSQGLAKLIFGRLNPWSDEDESSSIRVLAASDSSFFLFE
jgi:hypothetical protein